MKFRSKMIGKFYSDRHRNPRIMNVSLGVFDDGTLLCVTQGDIYSQKNLEKFISSVNEKYGTSYQLQKENSHAFLKIEGRGNPVTIVANKIKTVLGGIKWEKKN